jgi:tetratricopeptide (TPR) repeat protein
MKIIQEEINLKLVPAIAAILLIIGFTQATSITVCPESCDYKSIQSAVYAAKPGDTVEVHSGTYNESVVLTKDINFKGIDTGNGEAIVNGGLYKNGFNSSLRGFSFEEVTSGLSWSYDMVNQNTTFYLLENASEIGSKSPTKGLAIINNVLKTNPNDAWAWFRKGYVLSFAQRYEDSIDAYNESLKIDPYYYISWINIGDDLDGLERYNEAIQAYNKAIEINPRYASAWNSLGNDLYRLKKYNESIDAYNRAIEINPDEAVYWENKGGSLMALGQTTEADAAFAKAEELDT